MDLILYGFLMLVSLVLIIIGLAKPTESAQSLVGFFFLFLLGLVLINGNLEVKTGEMLNTTYIYGGNFSGYHWDYTGEPEEPRPQDPDLIYLFHTEETTANVYTSFDDITSHRLGYWLCIASAIGFIGNLFSIGKTKWGEE